jgi:hypothetical protein
MSTQDIQWFEVTSDGLLADPGIPEPKIRAEVFERVDLSDGHDLDGLINLIRRCEPLAQRFRNLGEQYLQENTGSVAFLRDLGSVLSARIGNQQLILRVLRQDLDDGWARWIELSGDKGLETFRQVVSDWLAEEIDWRESEFFDSLWNGQVAAYGHFEDQPRSVLKAIGVRAIDGDHPGSTYRAAELHKDIQEANQAAERLGLDCRFRVASQEGALS